jgi:3-oxoacyl-[acyl-carrier-protein] synthase-3
MNRTVIIGTGSYIPPNNISNFDFAHRSFFDEISNPINIESTIVAQKLQAITGIEERRYASDDHTTSELALEAAKLAVADSGIDIETLDQIIVAHNFGDVVQGSNQTDNVPSLASRVKNGLGIQNPSCIAYDLLFGCPGWLQGVINADAFIKAGLIKRCLIIGAETLSRVVDIHDRDSMIFSDGAGAVVLESIVDATENAPGILSASAQSHCTDETYFIYLGKSYNPDTDPSIRYIKMKGRKVYEYAVKQVPLAIKDCIDKSGIPIEEIKKVFIHQANEKMDEAIIRGVYKLYGKPMPEGIMPMNIQKLGNSSVATIPTLFDMVLKGALESHEVNKGDVVVMASVGAGMNINAICYRM